MKAALRLFLAFALLIGSNGSSGWLLFAQEVYDAKSGKFVPVAKQRAGNAKAGALSQASTKQALASDKAPTQQLRQVLQAIEQDQRLGSDQKQQAIDYFKRYGGVVADTQSAEAEKALDALVKDLRNPDKDPGIALAGMFDRLSEFSRRADGRTVMQVTGDAQNQRIAVHSTLVGKTLFFQQGVKVDPTTTIKTITRPDPDDPAKEDSVEAIIRETKKGAAVEQRVLYNRKVHQLFHNLKKLYYDQCGLARRINNGEALIITEKQAPGCQGLIGNKDPKLTEETRRKLREFYDANQNRFPKDLLKYMEMLDGLKAQGKLGSLSAVDPKNPNGVWRQLEHMQRMAMAFYSDNQLEMYQRVVIMQLTNYFSQVTNVQPKQKKGDEQLDINAKDLKEFQRVLDDFRKGDMQGYSWFLSKLGYTNLSENDKRYITPELMALAAEAFADVAYASKSQARLLGPGGAKLNGEERDALIEETQQWLKLAQIQIQRFDMHTQAIQLTRLVEGKIQGTIGISPDDKGMIAQAEKLAATAREQYLPLLAEANVEAKKSLLRQTLATFYRTYRNAMDAHLYDETLAERLRLLAGKAEQMKELYLAAEFEKVRGSDEYTKGFSAMEKVTAGAYRYFLNHLPPEVDRVRRLIDEFKKDLDALSQLKNFQAIRGSLLPIEERFKSLVNKIEGGSIPHVMDTQKESQKLSVKHGRIFAAVQSFSNNMRLFDMINELEIYVDKYASSKIVTSRSDNWWTVFASFKWMDAAFNVGGFRENAVNGMMGNADKLPFGLMAGTQEAFEKLKKNTKARDEIKQLLRLGRFAEAYDKIADMDREAANRAILEAKWDKLEEEKGDLLDFEGLLGKQYDTDAQTGAIGATTNRFNLLPKLIMGYAVASAVFDTAATAALTVVMGPLLSWASRGAELLVTAGKFTQVVKAIDSMQKAGFMAKTMNLMLRLTVNTVTGSSLLQYGGKVILNVGRNFRKILALPQGQGLGAALRQIVTPSTWGYAAKSSINSTLMMTGISGVMQSGLYLASPDNGQYGSLSEAFVQGAAQGASFGAKGGILFHLNPFPYTAFSGNTATIMRGVAETSGPINWTSQFVAKVVPGWSKSAVAEGGLLGAVSKWSMGASPTLNMAGRLLTFGGGIADGMVKYWLAAEAPRHVVQMGYMVYNDKRYGDGDLSKSNTPDGATAYMDTLAHGYHKSMTMAELSWLLLPSNPAFSPKEIGEQVRSAKMYNALVGMGPKEQRAERLREIAFAPNGFEITVALPWQHRTMVENLRSLLPSSRRARTETFTVNPQWSQMAATQLMKGGRGLTGMDMGHLLAIANAPSEGLGQVISINRLVEGQRDPEKFAKDLKFSQSEGESYRSIKVRDPVTGQWREAKPHEARIVKGPEGVETIEVLNPKTGQMVPAGSSGGLVSRESYAGKADQVKITLETIAAAKEIIDQRLGGLKGRGLRAQILSAGETLVLGGVEVKGQQLKEIKQSAAMAEMETMPVTRNPLTMAREMAGRARDVVLDRKLESKQQMIVRHLREQTQREAERIVRDPGKKIEVVREQLGDLVNATQNAADKAALQKVADILDGPGSAGQRISRAQAELDAAARLKTDQVPGIPATKLRELLDGLGREEVGALARAREHVRELLNYGKEFERMGQTFDPAHQAALEKVLGILEGSTGPGAASRAKDVIETLARQEPGKMGVSLPKSALLDLAASLERLIREGPGSAAPKERIDAVRAKAEELLAQATEPGDKATLKKVSIILSSPVGERTIARTANILEAAIEQKAQGTAGVPTGTFRALSESLGSGRGSPTADLIMLSARRVIGQRIGEHARKGQATRAEALNVLRQTLESDASRQVVISQMLQAFKSGSAEEVNRSIDLYLDIWERGVFGQMVGERVVKTGKNGKQSLEWQIPEDRQLKSRGSGIPGFRPLQRRVIRDTLKNISEGAKMHFGQMPTGGGKTLTNFTLIEFLDAHAKANGRDGVFYVTTNPDLVAQARADYIGSFGKKPAFEIITYGELSARIAQAREQGAASPTDKFYIVGDEGDKPASEVPTSVGMFNGKLSKAKMDPVQIALQLAVRRIVDGTAEGTGLLQRFPGRKINERTFAQKLRDDPAFREAFKAEVHATARAMNDGFKTLKSKEFRDSIDLTLYPEYLALYNGNAALARSELQKTIIAEFKHAKHTALQLHGGFERWVERLLQGAYQWGSHPERSTVMIKDPDPHRGTLKFNNGTAYDNLSTLEGPAGDAYFGRPVQIDFESLAQINFRQLLEQVRDSGTIFFATSGTAAARIREVLKTDFGFKFTGEISIADPMQVSLLRSGEKHIDVKELKTFIHTGNPDKPNLVVFYIHTKEQREELEKTLIDGGFDPGRISVRVRGGSALEEQERHSQKVRLERNDAAFDKGVVEIAIIEGWAGLRGLEAPLSKYKSEGRELMMKILDPQELPTEELVQLIGRLAPGRTEGVASRQFSAMVRMDRLLASDSLAGAALEIAGLVRKAATRGELEAARALIEELPPGRYDPAALVRAITQRDLDQRHFGEKGYAKKSNEVWDEIILPTIKDPNKLEAGRLVTQISEIVKLRESLTKGERELLLQGKVEDAGRMLEMLVRNPEFTGRKEFLEVLVAAIGRRMQEDAISSSGILDPVGSSRWKAVLADLRGRFSRNRGGVPAAPQTPPSPPPSVPTP